MKLDGIYIVLCNFSYLEQDKELNGVRFLPLWIGERVKIIAENGNWCYGYYENQVELIGLFPKSHIQEIGTNSLLINTEANQIITEITETVKIWWSCVKKNYVNEYTLKKSEQFIQCIKDLMIIRNKISSGNVPDIELKEIQLVNILKKVKKIWVLFLKFFYVKMFFLFI